MKMKLIPILANPLMNMKVTLEELELLLNIDGLKTVLNISDKTHVPKIKTYAIIRKFQKKGIIKLIRRLDN